jgi:hypothetical protein
MKFRYAHLAVVTTIVIFIGAAGADGPKKPAVVQGFTGEIMDSICAGYKGHSYMMQQLKSMGTDKESCIKSCITQLGAKYVLFDRAQQKAYRIDNPDKVEPLAGRSVHISGVLIKKDRINVNDIKATD